MRAILTALLAATGHEGAVSNAREAATELSRRRVEREAVELYLAGLEAPVVRLARAEGGQPQEVVHG
jgi:hypothetical protein